MSEQSLSRSSSRRKKSSDHGHEKKKKIKSIANYTLGDVLGKGGFGVVYRGLNQNDGSQVAVKQVSLKKCSKEQVEDIHSEINLLKKLHHDLIVRYIDHKQSKTKLYIIIEYVSTNHVAIFVCVCVESPFDADMNFFHGRCLLLFFNIFHL